MTMDGYPIIHFKYLLANNELSVLYFKTEDSKPNFFINFKKKFYWWY